MSVSCNICESHGCCVVNCFKGNSVRDDLIQHFSNVISRNYNLQSSSRVKEESNVCHDFFSASADDSGNVTNCGAFPVIYGHGLFDWKNNSDQQFYLCDFVSFEPHIKKLLKFMSVQNIGMASPYLSISGSQRKLILEIEESNSQDLNHLPHVSCLIWFVLHKDLVKPFEQMVCYLLHEKVRQIVLLNLLGQRNPSLEIQVEDVQKVNSCLIIQGSGDRCILSQSLDSIVDSERVTLVREVRIRFDTPHSLAPSTNVASEVHSEALSNEISMIDSSSPETSLPEGEHTEKIDVDELLFKTEPEENNEIPSVSPDTSDILLNNYDKSHNEEKHAASSTSYMHSSSSEGTVQEKCTCVGPQVLQCPACSFVLKGGEDRVERLILHIKRYHASKYFSLQKQVRVSYPFRPCPLISSNFFLRSKVKLPSSCHLKIINKSK